MTQLPTSHARPFLASLILFSVELRYANRGVLRNYTLGHAKLAPVPNSFLPSFQSFARGLQTSAK